MLRPPTIACGTEHIVLPSSPELAWMRRLPLPSKNGDWASFGQDQACGYLAIAGLLIEANRRNLKARRLSLCNSGDATGVRDRIVGYGAWMFG
jgi:hypothetical protein